MSDVQHLLSKVSSAYRIIPEDYPVVAKLTPEETFVFSISHTSKHIAKALGKIAGQIEEADHGGVVDKEVLRKATFSLLISTLKLADEQEISAEEIITEVPKHI